MRRVNQAGSIGVFVIVGAILVAASLAILYGIRQNTLSQSNSPISNDLVASQDSSNKETQENSKTEKSSQEKSNSQSAGRGEAKSEVKTEDSKPVTTPETPSQSSPQTSQQADKDLPQTGPENLLVSAVVVGGLSFIAVAYQRSRYLL